MTWAWWIAAVLVGLIVLLALAAAVMAWLGARLPEEHVAAAAVRLARAPAEVFSLLADYPAHARAMGADSVEPLPDDQGRPRYRQRVGRNAFVMTRTGHRPPELIQWTIGDDAAFFSGRWTYELRPEAGGTLVRLSEHGRVPGKLPRFMMKHLIGYHVYLRKSLRALAAQAGEPGAEVRSD